MQNVGLIREDISTKVFQMVILIVVDMKLVRKKVRNILFLRYKNKKNSNNILRKSSSNGKKIRNRGFDMKINRDFYLNKLIEGLDDGLVKIVTGIRRCGKSYLLDHIFKNYLVEQGVKEDHIIKLDLDE